MALERDHPRKKVKSIIENNIEQIHLFYCCPIYNRLSISKVTPPSCFSCSYKCVKLVAPLEVDTIHMTIQCNKNTDFVMLIMLNF